MKSKSKKSASVFPDAMPPVFVPPKKKKPRKIKKRKRVREVRYESEEATALIRG